MSDRLRESTVAFFDEFVTAFATFDGATIAERYLAPYLAMRADGTSACFQSRAEIARYFQGVVDDYHAQGCRACRYRDLELTAIGPRCALATVTWELLHGDGHVLTRWRESYDLLWGDGRLRVFTSIDHPDGDAGSGDADGAARQGRG